MIDNGWQSQFSCWHVLLIPVTTAPSPSFTKHSNSSAFSHRLNQVLGLAFIHTSIPNGVGETNKQEVQISRRNLKEDQPSVIPVILNLHWFPEAVNKTGRFEVYLKLQLNRNNYLMAQNVNWGPLQNLISCSLACSCSVNLISQKKKCFCSYQFFAGRETNNGKNRHFERQSIQCFLDKPRWQGEHYFSCILVGSSQVEFYLRSPLSQITLCLRGVYDLYNVSGVRPSMHVSSKRRRKEEGCVVESKLDNDVCVTDDSNTAQQCTHHRNINRILLSHWCWLVDTIVFYPCCLLFAFFLHFSCFLWRLFQ